MRMAAIAAVIVCGTALHANAQPQAENPDWPCQQRLISELAAGSYWTGPAVNTSDYSWHDDEKLTALVENAVNRDTPDSEAVAALTTYADSLPKDQRGPALARLFGALVNETNDERGLVIARIEQISARQRNLGDLIAKLSNEADAAPVSDGAPKSDLVGQRDFNIKAFQRAQHTIRYACEVPGVFDRRLGLFAKTLQGKL